MNSKLVKTEGLIIRETAYGEGDCIYTVLTPQRGRVTVIGKAAKGSRSSAGIMSVGYYMNFVFYKKDSMCWMKECELVEPFMNIRSSIVASALSAYIMDVAYELSDDGQECYDILAVTFNCLYALNYKNNIYFTHFCDVCKNMPLSVTSVMSNTLRAYGW